MQKIVLFRLTRRKYRLDSFTLIELLTVMLIIAILAGLTLAAASAVMTQAARNRAASEIQAISAALENYKTDNGIYPQTSILLTNSAANPYSSQTLDGSVNGGLYQQSSQILYQALTGKTNFNDLPASGVKSYIQFKTTQLGNYKTAANTPYNVNTSTYIQDPWTYSYGYSTGNGTNSYPYNGNGFFDLWSTGGLISPNATNSNTWITNWK